MRGDAGELSPLCTVFYAYHHVAACESDSNGGILP